MLMCELRVTEIGQLIDDIDEFIVVGRIPEDRSSGFTEIWHPKKGKVTYYWDRDNPEVIFKGVGRLEQTIVRV